jgi:hypothetical protein
MGDEPAAAAADRDREQTPSLGEPELDRVTGLGASLVVTETRVVLIRDGANRRPRSGVRAWPHAGIQVHLDPPRRGGGRVVLSVGSDAGSVVSLFVAAVEWPSAERVAREIRRQAAKARPDRSGPTSPPPVTRPPRS